LGESTNLKVNPVAGRGGADFSPKGPINGLARPRTASRVDDVAPMWSEIGAIGPGWRRLCPVSDRTRIESEGGEA
jgi:hypothetical protein